MSDLEEVGLLFAPHTSAGRLPTELGLRLFVDGLMEVGGLTAEEREAIDGQCGAIGRSLPEMLEQASMLLSGLSRCAGLVMAPKTERALKHIEFVHLAPGRALVVLVTEGGMVENRLIDVPMGLPHSTLVEATNYLTARLVGRTLGMARKYLRRIERPEGRAGRTDPQGGGGRPCHLGRRQSDSALIVRGQAQLLDDIQGG